MARIAAKLDDAFEVLNLEPIEFSETKTPTAASDPSFYVEPPPREEEGDGMPGPGPAEQYRKKLLVQGPTAKLFLSGHVGSGKSTQINKLATDPIVRGAFSVVLLRIEGGHQAFLDASQLLFLMAGAIFDFGQEEGLLTEDAQWKTHLRDLDARLYGPSGTVTKERALSAEFTLLFVKVREELKLTEHRRRQFRELGETLQTLLVDVIKGLVLDIEHGLIRQARHHSILLLIDDLDKVRGPEQQKNIFHTNLEALVELPLRVLYTVPTGVVFGSNRAQVRRSLEHLYPIRVLDKAPDGFDPEKFFLPGSDKFFREALDRRIEPHLFTDEAVRLAAIYAGGVLREFFRLLWSAVFIARHNKLEAVDERAVRAAVRDERRRETMGLLASDYQALRVIHRTHALATDEDRRYLDEGRVLECYNDKTWYDVNPLLWKVLPQD